MLIQVVGRILHDGPRRAIPDSARRLWWGLVRPSRKHHEPDLKAARFDQSRGVETGGFIPVEELGDVVGRHIEDAVHYHAVASGLFHRMIRDLGVKLSDYVFVDLGCGKGKALLLAAELPFREVVGVEFAPALADVAARNLQADRAAHRCGSARVEAGDAAEFEFPDQPLVVFLYNPFGPVVLDLVAARLAASLASRPRPALILYCNPVHSETLERAGFRPVRTRTLYRIYRGHDGETP